MSKKELLSIRICDWLKKMVVDAYDNFKSSLGEDSLKVETKLDSDIAGDLVTTADREIEDFLRRTVQADFPEYNIVSEERGGDWGSAGKNYFTIDPIDGTINFAHGLPLWGIQMACVTDGEPCASVIFAPALGELYSASLAGAYKNDAPICVNNFGIDRGICDIEGHAKRSARQIFQDRFVHMRDLNSTAIAMTWVACGRLSAVGYYGGDDIYNYLPGMFLVQQAGGVILDFPDVHIAANNNEFLDVLKG